MLGTVALVGRPSAGKSTIFNRIVGERRSIVEETPGVTRDRLYAHAEWLTKQFTVIDTGGIQLKDAPFQTEIRAQCEIAMEEADLVVFVTDAHGILTDDDRLIARMLHQKKKKTILVANKIDNIESIGDMAEYYRLGFGEPMAVSGVHGIGIGDLLDRIVKELPEREVPDYQGAISFSLIGRPNVGKSSLVNRLIGQERSIVASIEGTTRDSTDTPFERDGTKYVAIDTAGLLKRGKIYESIDKYAALRALSAIDRSEVSFILIDASEGIREQDKHVAGYAFEANKAMGIVVNKWDLAKKMGKTKEGFTKEIRTAFKFLDFAPIIFLSALTGEGCQKVLEACKTAHEAYNRRVSTAILNDIVRDAQEINPTPDFHHGRLKIYFASQPRVAPPTFVMFCNDPKHAHFSYTRYLENRFREAFDFDGTPIKIIYRERK